MYKLLIVDDERRVREGLAGKIDWPALGIHPCGMADDGETALPLLQQLQPDILLTDVRMRRMDGLELSTKARALLPGLEVVFISGYSDSEYIREALRLKAVDYVYKPVNLQEVTRIMRRVTAKLDDRAQEAAAHSRMQVLLEKSLPLLQERFLNDWFRGRLMEKREILQRIEALRLPLFPALPLLPLVLAIDSSAMEESLAQLSLCESLREALPRTLLCPSGREIIALTQPEDDRALAEIPGILESVFARLAQENAGAIRASAGVAAAVWDVAEVADGVNTARAALRNRFFLGGSRVLFFDHAERRLPRSMPLKMPALLEEHLRAGNRDALESCIQETLNRARQGQDMEHARLLCMQIALAVEAALESCGASAGLALDFCPFALTAGTFDTLEKALNRLVHSACAQVESLRLTRGGGTADAVRTMIAAHYADKLTIDRIAQELHYSPTYLSMLFKQETGETIGDALVDARMREAMRLLRETDEMIYQIAVRVGYPEQAHFARLFKRMTGMTPGEYRKQALT